MVSKSMIFIGFSGQDYNFKRIIHNIDKEEIEHGREQHYIFLCMEDIISTISVKRGENLTKDEVVLLAYSFMRLREQYLNAYGIRPIWTSWKKLPEDLAGVVV